MSGALVLAFAALLITGAGCRWLAGRPLLLDEGGPRSLHRGAIPRTGGLVMVPVMLAAFAAVGELPVPAPLGIGAAFLLLAATSLRDDVSHIDPRGRVASHTITALIVAVSLALGEVAVLPGVVLSSPWLLWPAVTLMVVWCINLNNFMDGMDGIAATMAVIGHGLLAVLAWDAGDVAFAQAELILVGTAAGFLLVNRPPARIFMGDLGAAVFGLTMAVAILSAEQRGILPTYLGVLLFAPFIADATFTLVRRALRRAPLSQAHREHWYQALVLAGHPPSRVLLLESALMLACGSTVWLVRDGGHMLHWSVLALWSAVFVGLQATVPWLESRQGAERAEQLQLDRPPE